MLPRKKKYTLVNLKYDFFCPFCATMMNNVACCKAS